MTKKMTDIAVVVQARLGSQRVPQKMIKPFAGTTLMDIMLKKVKKSNIIDMEHFYVSAYEKELVDICEKHGVKVFNRSEESANSEGTPLTQMYEWWDKLPYTYCVLLNACAPFMTIETIDKFIREYSETNSDGLFGVMEKKNYFWNLGGEMITNWPVGQACMNTKFVEVTYEAAHCLYAGRMDRIGEGIWMGDFNKAGDIELYAMKEEETLDIDYQWQFDMCESLYQQTKEGK